jgi:hypothetical protein
VHRDRAVTVDLNLHGLSLCCMWLRRGWLPGSGRKNVRIWAGLFSGLGEKFPFLPNLPQSEEGLSATLLTTGDVRL